jgi:hypothetical protein
VKFKEDLKGVVTEKYVQMAACEVGSSYLMPSLPRDEMWIRAGLFGRDQIRNNWASFMEL